MGKKETLFSVDGNIENVQEFVYMGKVIPNNNKEVTIEQQTSKATAKFIELRSVLTGHDVNMATRR